MSPYALSGWCQSLNMTYFNVSKVHPYEVPILRMHPGGKASKQTTGTRILLRIRMIVLTSGVVSS
jgi:hypothetical protein